MGGLSGDVGFTINPTDLLKRPLRGVGDHMRMTAISNSMNGMMRAMAQFDRSAHALNQAMRPNSAADPVKPVVESLQAKHALTANAAVMRTADEMEKRVLDILV